MKARTAAIFLFLSLFGITSHAANEDRRIVAYFPTWERFPEAIHEVDLEPITHLMIAFVNPHPDDPDQLRLPNGLEEVVRAAKAKDVQVLLSIGGGAANQETYASVLHPDRVDAFAERLLQTVLEFDLAGIDVDLEHRVLHADDEAPMRYETFVRALGSLLRENKKILSAALATSFGKAITPEAAKQFDFISLMSYDATGTWRPERPGQHSSFELAERDLRHWSEERGIDPKKLLVGIPFYGRAWGTYTNSRPDGSGLSYRQIVELDPQAHLKDQLGSGGNAVYYNGISMVRRKSRLGFAEAGGVMFWHLLGDTRDERSLLNAIADESK